MVEEGKQREIHTVVLVNTRLTFSLYCLFWLDYVCSHGQQTRLKYTRRKHQSHEKKYLRSIILAFIPIWVIFFSFWPSQTWPSFCWGNFTATLSQTCHGTEVQKPTRKIHEQRTTRQCLCCLCDSGDFAGQSVTVTYSRVEQQPNTDCIHSSLSIYRLIYIYLLVLRWMAELMLKIDCVCSIFFISHAKTDCHSISAMRLWKADCHYIPTMRIYIFPSA